LENKNRNIDYPNSQTINIYDKLNQKNAAFIFAFLRFQVK